MRTVAQLAAVAVLAGCFGSMTTAFDELPKVDRQRYTRCQRRLTPTSCGNEPPLSFACQVVGKREYAEAETARERKRWLLEAGCPPSMVDPDAYMADDAPPRRQQQAQDVQEDQPMPRKAATQAKDDE